LAFAISLVHGFVTVTYLETFKNAGVLEVWVGTKPHDYGSDGSIKTDENAERKARPYVCGSGNEPINQSQLNK
jgi:hypothetical protein